MIGILFTGGTISMRVDPATGAAVPALTAQEVLAQTPELKTVCDVEIEDFSRLPGPHVTPDQMWRLARRVAAWLERPDVDGVVITHGTDTIEETAYLLDLVLLSDKPVALVGAMRTISDASWDGPANLVAAAHAGGQLGPAGGAPWACSSSWTNTSGRRAKCERFTRSRPGLLRRRSSARSARLMPGR